MQTNNANASVIHICKLHKPTHKPKLAKEHASPSPRRISNFLLQRFKKNKTPDTQANTTKTLKRSADNGLQGRSRRIQAGNTGLEKAAVQCSADTFVVKIATFSKPETLPEILNND